jgi:multiple sugar transport system permease protein
MRLLTKAFVVALVTVWSLPLLWVIFCSFTLHLLGGVPSTGDLTLTTANFKCLQQAEVIDAVLNSTWIALGSALLGTSAALLIAFGLLCRPVPMMKALMMVFSGRTVPPIAFLLPQYMFFRNIGIGSSRWALLLVDAFTAMSLCLVFVSPFLLRLHNAFFEQVQIDGASSYIYFCRVLLPQLKGPLLFSFIAAFMLSWSDFLFAGVFVVSEPTRTLPVLISSFLTSYGTAWGPML